MDSVRLGSIELGNMGSAHAAQAVAGKIARGELAAVCDVDDAKLQRFYTKMRFTAAGELMGSGQVDAVLIATPHFSHVPLGIAARS